MIRSIQRSNEWKTEMALFTAGAKTCPLNAKVDLQSHNINEYRFMYMFIAYAKCSLKSKVHLQYSKIITNKYTGKSL